MHGFTSGGYAVLLCCVSHALYIHLFTHSFMSSFMYLFTTTIIRRCQAISEAVKAAEADKKIQAVVLSSSLSNIFCAGLDLTELYEPDPVRLPKFWRSFQQVYLDLYGSRLATLAAIQGHAPAAGCMLALSCDYRIQSTTGSIGLNESKLGIVAPPWLGQQYIDTIGHRQAELALSLGTLFKPQEALQIGLVDEVVHKDEVVEMAKQRATEWVRIPPKARNAAKKMTRGRQMQQLLETRDQDTDHFCTFVSQEKVQRNLAAYLEQLAKRKK
jgi:3,2-trans-enoyl-CoA isomerase